jgi:hypothetical protein
MVKVKASIHLNFVAVFLKRQKVNKSLKHRTFGAGQFLSRSFVVLLRKSIPQNHNLKTAA